MEFSHDISAWTPGISPIFKSGEMIRGLIRGPCTTEHRDLQGEVLHQDGMDFSPFLGGIQKGEVTDGLTPGAVSYEHPVGIFTVVGEPLELVKGTTPDGVKCHVLTTRLHVDVGNELADGVWKQVEQLHKARSRVKLGYSVEGGAKLRASYNKRDPLYKDVLESIFTGVVVTARPRNRNALFDVIMASLQNIPGGEEIVKAALANARVVDDIEAPLQERVERQENARSQALVHVADELGLEAQDLAVAALLRKSDAAAWKRAQANLLRGVAARARA